MFIALSAVVWVAASCLGAILVLACIVGSIVLWVRGFVGLFHWGLEEWNRREITEEFPTPMPGQEEGVKSSPDKEESSFWKEAWESVFKTRTYRRQNKHQSSHFYVDPLLQVRDCCTWNRLLWQFFRCTKVHTSFLKINQPGCTSI